MILPFMTQKQACVRFYEELNDFLPAARWKKQFCHSFDGSPAIKDVIEALGVPHTEVDLILANGVSVDFSYQLQADDRIAVYPVFEALDISSLVHLREKPLRRTRFILDVHLGKTARILRMLGFDSLYRNDYDDHEIADLAETEQRIVLTRDRGLLKFKRITRGYWLRATKPRQQVAEVLSRFDLYSQIAPFHRCLRCNGLIQPVTVDRVAEQILPRTKRDYQEFFQCSSCDHVYWKGSHFTTMQQTILELVNHNKGHLD